MTTIERYKNAKIYQLIDYSTGNFYIGSTCLSLPKRLHIHKKASACKVNMKIYKIFNKEMFESGQIKIILIEEVDVQDKQHLLIEENKHIVKHINDPLCLNTLRSYVSEEQKKEETKVYKTINHEHIRQMGKDHYILNRDKILQQQKDYYNDNKDTISQRAKEHYHNNSEELKKKHKLYWEKNATKLNEKRKEKITCECGHILCKRDISKHIKSKKHLNYINNLGTPLVETN